MSRFGSTATFAYTSSDTFSAATTFVLTADSMPNYPFETFSETDRAIHTAKTGRKWAYSNYNLQGYRFNFVNLKESLRGSLKAMFDAKPLFTFNTNGSLWGTFRFQEETWEDQETAFELYDVSFGMLEDA